MNDRKIGLYAPFFEFIYSDKEKYQNLQSLVSLNLTSDIDFNKGGFN